MNEPKLIKFDKTNPDYNDHYADEQRYKGTMPK
jgi:hypothetical protein